MKKVLTILVVLALVCGAVFAAETHKITLKSTIGEVLPVFQLVRAAYAGTATDGRAVTAEEDFTNKTGGINANGVVEDGIRYSVVDDAEYALADLEVGDLSKYDVDVTFNVRISNAAKSVRVFTLTFDAGAFSVSRNKVVESQAATTTALSANTNLVAASGITAAVNGQVLTATFNGTTLSENGTLLGTYNVVYPADSTIDPSVGNSTEATYTADITLTITT